MAKKKRKKNKKKKSFLFSGIIVFLLLIIVAILFFNSNMGKQLLADISANIPESIVTGSVQNEKEDTSENSDGEKESSTENTAKTDTDGKLFRVDFIDVGQGDSALVTTPGGKFILVDTGPAEATGNILKLLEERGAREIDYLVLSHPHSDHIGSAREILYSCKVNNIIMPNVSVGASSFERLLEAIAFEKQQGCKVYSAVPGNVYELDGCSMTIHGPLEIDDDELNNCSVVMTVKYSDFSVLFTGDAETMAEKKIIDNGTDISCDVLKVGHHGSSTASCDKFLDAANPSVAVISCEKSNSYGHPSSEVLSALAERGAEYYLTCERGNVTILSDGKNFNVECEK